MSDFEDYLEAEDSPPQKEDEEITDDLIEREKQKTRLLGWRYLQVVLGDDTVPPKERISAAEKAFDRTGDSAQKQAETAALPPIQINVGSNQIEDLRKFQEKLVGEAHEEVPTEQPAAGDGQTGDIKRITDIGENE